MDNNAFNIVRFLFESDPVLWACPIQEGIPFLLSKATYLLGLAAAILVIFGIIFAAISYMTAFGNEDRAKKGRETLKWVVIGALVIIFSQVVISAVIGMIAERGSNIDINSLKAESCQTSF